MDTNADGSTITIFEPLAVIVHKPLSARNQMKQNVCETERGLPALKIEYVRSLNQISTGSFPHCKSNRKKTSLSPTIQIDEKVSEEI